MKISAFLFFLVLCFSVSFEQAFCASRITWYRQPPYRYYWKEQRRYQQYLYNQQNQREAPRGQESEEEPEGPSHAMLNMQELKAGIKKIHGEKRRGLYEKKTDAE